MTAGAGSTVTARNPLARGLWLLSGLVAVGLGGLGVIVPGLPTTGFFVLAAWCFSKSSRRLERWVLELPGVGPMVQDYRAGLGMPRRAKVIAIGMMVLFGGASAVLFLDHLVIRLVVVAAVAVGVWYVGWRIPTHPGARPPPA